MPRAASTDTWFSRCWNSAVFDEAPLTVISWTKNWGGMAGITKPVSAPPVSTIAQGQAAIDTSRSPSAYDNDSSTSTGIADSALEFRAAKVAALYTL